MNIPQAEKTLPKPLRLWPGAAIVVIQWLLRFVLPIMWPEKMILGVLGSLVCAVALVVWWAFFSRARISERLGAIGLMIAAGFVTYRFLDVSIATGGQRMLFALLVTPGLCLAFVVWAVATQRLAGGIRWATMAAAILLACGFWTLLRTGGFNSNLNNDLMWRWAKSPEERLLTQADETPAVPATPVAAKPEEVIPSA